MAIIADVLLGDVFGIAVCGIIAGFVRVGVSYLGMHWIVPSLAGLTVFVVLAAFWMMFLAPIVFPR